MIVMMTDWCIRNGDAKSPTNSVVFIVKCTVVQYTVVQYIIVPCEGNVKKQF